MRVTTTRLAPPATHGSVPERVAEAGASANFLANRF
jgi:hypothetical protein